jgi:hypothetical protein
MKSIYRLNYALITFLPKEVGASNLKKFRPISLMNYSFKIFVQALNNRQVPICDRLLACNQIAFVKNKFILKSIVSTHEILHKAVKEK